MDSVQAIRDELGDAAAEVIAALPMNIQCIIGEFIEDKSNQYEESAREGAEREALRLYIQYVNEGREAKLAAALRRIEDLLEGVIEDMRRHATMGFKGTAHPKEYAERLEDILSDDVVAAATEESYAA